MYFWGTPSRIAYDHFLAQPSGPGCDVIEEGTKNAWQKESFLSQLCPRDGLESRQRRLQHAAFLYVHKEISHYGGNY